MTGNIKENDISIENWEQFALTFDGYLHCGGKLICGELANETVITFHETGELPNLSLADLRARLFFEQRRAHWLDDDDFELDEKYINALLDTIRQKVYENQQ